MNKRQDNKLRKKRGLPVPKRLRNFKVVIKIKRKPVSKPQPVKLTPEEKREAKQQRRIENQKLKSLMLKDPEYVAMLEAKKAEQKLKKIILKEINRAEKIEQQNIKDYLQQKTKEETKQRRLKSKEIKQRLKNDPEYIAMIEAKKARRAERKTKKKAAQADYFDEPTAQRRIRKLEHVMNTYPAQQKHIKAAQTPKSQKVATGSEFEYDFPAKVSYIRKNPDFEFILRVGHEDFVHVPFPAITKEQLMWNHIDHCEESVSCWQGLRRKLFTVHTFNQMAKDNQQGITRPRAVARGAAKLRLERSEDFCLNHCKGKYSVCDLSNEIRSTVNAMMIGD